MNDEYEKVINDAIVNYYKGESVSRFLSINDSCVYNINTTNLGSYCAASLRQFILKDKLSFIKQKLVNDDNASIVVGLFNVIGSRLSISTSIVDVKKNYLEYAKGILKFLHHIETKYK